MQVARRLSDRGTRGWAVAPLLLGLFVSTLTHGTAAIAMLLGGASSGGGRGEEGLRGGGDTAIDVSLAGPEATVGTAAPVATTAPPPEVIPTATAAPTAPAALPVDPEAPAVAETSTPQEPPPSIFVTPPVLGGGASVTNGGRTPGAITGPVALGINGSTIEGQRALLPRAATCKDPIAGTWEAHKYNANLGGLWVHFTLAVHRGTGGALVGPILSHTWSGSPLDSVPPECRAGAVNMTVSMNATGVDGGNGRITFGATRYSVVSVECRGVESSYAPDHFSGTIDPQRQEFQSVNNDGLNDINAPYVFRRTGCLDE